MEKVFLVPTACNGSLTTCRPYQCVKPNVLWIGMTTGRVRTGFLHSRTPPMGLDPRHRFGPIINQVFFSGPRLAPPAPFSPRPKSWPNQKKNLNEAKIHFCLPSPFRHCIYNKHKTQYTQFLPQYITVTPQRLGISSL